MANGDTGVRIPGVVFAGGISNTALLVGGAAVVAWLWITHAQNQRKRDFGDLTNMNKIYQDVVDYSAYPSQVSVNMDRVKSAIARLRTAIQTARDAFKKTLHDLIKAKREGTISNAQFQEQLRIAIEQFKLTVSTQWQVIHQELGIATHNSHAVNVFPTVS